jgi:chromosome segregation ATPase
MMSEWCECKEPSEKRESDSVLMEHCTTCNSIVCDDLTRLRARVRELEAKCVQHSRAIEVWQREAQSAQEEADGLRARVAELEELNRAWSLEVTRKDIRVRALEAERDEARADFERKLRDVIAGCTSRMYITPGAGELIIRELVAPETLPEDVRSADHLRGVAGLDTRLACAKEKAVSEPNYTLRSEYDDCPYCDELRARVAELEANVEACSLRNERDADRIAHLEAELAALGRRGVRHRAQAEARIAELEAERDEALRAEAREARIANLMEAERDEAREDYREACATVAQMHAAAVGEVTGPKRGVVEDVADAVAAARRKALEEILEWYASSPRAPCPACAKEKTDD